MINSSPGLSLLFCFPSLRSLPKEDFSDLEGFSVFAFEGFICLMDLSVLPREAGIMY